jgi:hypothetical protein
MWIVCPNAAIWVSYFASGTECKNQIIFYLFIHYPNFESAIVKLIDETLLNYLEESEELCCNLLRRKETLPMDDQVQKVKDDLEFIPPTSNVQERLFSVF